MADGSGIISIRAFAAGHQVTISENYEFRLISDGGECLSAFVARHADDAAATAFATRLAAPEAESIEVWQGDRFLGRFRLAAPPRR